MSGSFVRSGKVRDLYDVGADRLLLVASDRISAFDVVLPTEVPDKGKVLTGLSRYWFAETSGIVANHLLSTDLRDVDPADLPADWGAMRPAFPAAANGSNLSNGGATSGEAADAAGGALSALRGRVMLCRRVDVLPVEVIVRGFLAGSAWTDYRRTGEVGGIRLPEGLRQGDRLPEPILTPSTKAEGGAHDETIDFDRFVRIAGGPLAERLRAVALRLYEAGAARCEAAGILLADTKFEFGVWPGPQDLVLVDEVLTPDSSRFWEASTWAPGGAQQSFDKQFVRDWLEAQAWDKAPPAPALPADVVRGTRERYVTAFERITGASFERYLEEDVISA
jgi:phosphoribosylaminoimidazole-succinocarboxamide synthase